MSLTRDTSGFFHAEIRRRGVAYAYQGRVQIIDADQDAVTARVRGTAPPVTALLLRPDCYVAWATASPRPTAADLEALRAARARWFAAGAA